jgi:cation diffusion facilitator CzcD-associated flavoprotein CzcO
MTIRTLLRSHHGHPFHHALLGCFAKRVTFYSQQVRALNLAYGLLETGTIEQKSRVAIVGAGASGMTIAVALAKRGISVTVFEQLQEPLELLANSRPRFIHPNIYEWPDWDAEVEAAGLPVLDWRASVAETLAARLRSRWKELRDGRIDVHTGVRMQV